MSEQLLQAILDELVTVRELLTAQAIPVQAEQARQLGAMLAHPVKGPEAIRANNTRVLAAARRKP